MIKEALQYLAERFTKAETPFHLHPPQEPEHVYLLNGEKVVADPKPRSHQPWDLSAVIEFGKTYETSKLWYSRNGVCLFIDDDVRRDRLDMPLEFSPQLETIQGWGDASKPMGQRDLILLLRTMFKRNMTRCPKLLDVIRSLKFESGKVTTSAVGSSKASISKSIESKVSGADDLPDDVYFNVPIFQEPFANMEGVIDVALEMDGGTEKFTLHPIPGTVEQQICLAEKSIGAKLIEELGEDRVFYGTP
jgi:hypothetical protein